MHRQPIMEHCKECSSVNTSAELHKIQKPVPWPDPAIPASVKVSVDFTWLRTAELGAEEQ